MNPYQFEHEVDVAGFRFEASGTTNKPCSDEAHEVEVTELQWMGVDVQPLMDGLFSEAAVDELITNLKGLIADDWEYHRSGESKVA